MGALDLDLQPVVIFILFCVRLSKQDSNNVIDQDILLPYKFPNAPHHRHRRIRECQPVKYGDFTFEIYPSHNSIPHTLPLVETRPFVKTVGSYWDKRDLIGHYFAIHHPEKTFSVLEPSKEGGCQQNITSTVEVTASNYKQKCIVATNAGFFNVHSGECMGDLVSDGRQVYNTGGMQNPHLGITKDGNIFVGYLPPEIHLEETFSQLITGVIWLVRNGENYVDVSVKSECPDNQSTGSLQYFADVQSARLAVGHDHLGRIVIVQIDGRTGERGCNLHELADLLISWGVVNAINLDGGGSVTAVLNNTLINTPGDSCENQKGSYPETYQCARNVSSALCVHEFECNPADCHGNGDCKMGICFCHGNWIGPFCNELQCGLLNCSRHGLCTTDGCTCEPGWYDPECSTLCPIGKYGLNCSATCRCHNGGTCLPEDGSCICPPGYTGDTCEQECPYGRYGQDCRQICYCEDSCMCHHVNGACNVSLQYTSLWEAAQCLSMEIIAASHLVPDNHDQYKLWLITVIFISLVASGSLILNIVLLCCRRETFCDSCDYNVQDLPQKLAMRRKKSYRQKRVYNAPIIISDSDSSSLSDAEIALSQEWKYESSKFLSKVGEKCESEERTNSFSFKSPTSPGLYMQSRNTSLPDITHTINGPVTEAVPLQEFSYIQESNDKNDVIESH